MIVTENLCDEVLGEVMQAKYLGFDTETYGLEFGKRMFAMQLCTNKRAFYFNFHDYRTDTPVLDKHRTLAKLSPLFGRDDVTVFIQNAKFDLHRLAYEDVRVDWKIHDTEVVERLIFNQHQSYSLENILKRRKLDPKLDIVKKWIMDNKAYTDVETKGKEKVTRILHYERVPFEMMYEYGIADVFGVYQAGIAQLDEYQEKGLDKELYETESRLVKTCLNMELNGVLIDAAKTVRGWEHEEEIQKHTEEVLSTYSSKPFKRGPTWLRETCDQLGIKYSLNPETSNPVFDRRFLESLEHPIGDILREQRRSDKYISTYYSSFLGGRDDRGFVHAVMRQAGTDTGRFSYSDPNLQNIPKEDEWKDGSEWPDDVPQVRSCIIPPEGYHIAAIDFSQQEFRLMLDYAGEKRLIKEVMEGKDLHQATADMVGVTRKQAKTLNFGLLYGMGVGKLAKALKISDKEARHIRLQYFDKLPKVEHLIYDVQRVAKLRKHIKTWAGRLLHFPDPKFTYKAPNHLIQGGCGDLCKIAMNKIDDMYSYDDSPVKMVIQVHDELVFYVKSDYLEETFKIRDTMKGIYKPKNGMYMDCTIEVSNKSWGQKDLEEYNEQIHTVS